MSNLVNYTYLYFDVRDYANNSVLSTYSLDITPVTFIPDYTSCELLSGARSISNKVLRWDFGDGTFSTELTAKHHYQWPGKYKARLTIYDKFGNAFQSSYNPTINVYDFVAQDFIFDDYGKFVYDVPASRIIDPLKILLRDSWQNKESLSGAPYTVSLYASGAAGDYQNIDNFYNDKWSHLRLLSRFYIKQFIGDTEVYTPTDSLTANTTEIYAKIDGNKLVVCSENDEGSTYAGITGFGELWYVDDRTKNYTSRENPIFIFATLDNQLFKDKLVQYQNLYDFIKPPPYGFQSLRPAVQPIIKVRHNSATRISLTTTGIDGEGTLSSTKFNIPTISWQHTQIPFVMRFKDEENYTTKTYPPLSSSTANPNISGLSAFDVSFGIVYQDETGFKPLQNVNFYEDFDDQVPQSIGGFYKGYFVPQDSALNCVLTASVVVVDPVNFPKDTIIGYISIPQYNSVLKLFREQKFNSCAGTVSMTLTAETSYTSTIDNRDILAIQVAPSGAGKGNDYQAWMADSINDAILKFNLNGEVSHIFKLSACPTLYNNSTIYVDYR
jgi:PKD repeat protein